MPISQILEEYAAKGVFKGYSQTGPDAWRMLWHRDQYFDLQRDGDALRFAVVLPKVSARSPMMRTYRAFVTAFQSKDLPEHKRIDPHRAKLKVLATRGAAGLEAKGAEQEYAVRKLIHVVHETYLVFLYDGAYHDYLIETFNLDPDHMA